MKAMRMIRMQVIGAGLVVALACTASVKAQEITNQEWANPNTVTASQQAQMAADAAKAKAAQQEAAPTQAAIEASAMNEVQISGEDGWVIGGLAVGAALVMYGLTKSKRALKARLNRAKMLNGQSAVTWY